MAESESLLGNIQPHTCCKDNSIRNFMDKCKKSIPLKMEGKDEEEKDGKKKRPRMNPMREPQRRKETMRNMVHQIP